MPWQRQVADTALEIDPDTGRLAYREVTVTVPRQAGKTTLLLSVMVWRALVFRSQRIVYTAQTAKDAREKWEDEQVPALEGSEFHSLFTTRKTNGSEAIRWRNGSLHYLMPTTEKAGHGKTLDLAVIDEAFAQVDNRLEQSCKPAMITRPEPQFWVISTAGNADSVYLRSKVDRGREMASGDRRSGVAYFEWSAPDELDAGAPETWRVCHPAIGHTITEDALAAESAAMEPAEFERAFLNRWVAGVTAAPIPVSVWNRRKEPDVKIGDDLCFAVDISPDRGYSSIAAAGPTGDERFAVELADRREGTQWLVPRLIEFWNKWSPSAVVVDNVGPAASLIPDLEAAGVRVVSTSAVDMRQACGRFYDAVLNDELTHQGQVDLDAAIAGAAKRKLGDAWAWSRSSSQVDISPLVAVTLALWGASTLEQPVAVDVAANVW